MFVQTAFRNMKRSETLEEAAIAKIRMQLDKFVTNPVGLRVWFECTGAHHEIHCVVTAGDGRKIHAREKSENFSDALDGVVAKLSRQLSRRKALRASHKRLREPWLYDVSALDDENRYRPTNWDDLN